MESDRFLLLKELVESERCYRSALSRCQGRAPEIFRSVRDQLGMSQRRIAERLGICHTYVSKIENGRLTPGFPVMANLGRMLEEGG
jgi:ribosome-binding protein aMBF1 (putative translation factor)